MSHPGGLAATGRRGAVATPPRPAVRGPWREEGSGTVLALALVAVLVATVAVVSTVGAAVVLRHRAEAAADLAALAGADVATGRVPGSACARAGRVAAVNGARLTGCWAHGDEVVVEVAVRPGSAGPLAGLTGAARASARAGPAEAAPTAP